MKRFRDMVALLRDRVPALLPVRVYLRASLPENVWGWTELKHSADGKASHFVIAVRRHQSWVVIRDTLLHEWAHAIAWRLEHETVCDHDPEWGLALSRCYQETIQP